jgi:hypothetical protein
MLFNQARIDVFLLDRHLAIDGFGRFGLGLWPGLGLGRGPGVGTRLWARIASSRGLLGRGAKALVLGQGILGTLILGPGILGTGILGARVLGTPVRALVRALGGDGRPFLGFQGFGDGLGL